MTGSSILHDAAAGRAIIQPWTVEQYHEAIKHGFIEETTAYELLDGLIVRKDRAKAGEDPTTVGDRHRIVVTRLAHLAPQFEPLGSFLQSQQPIALPPHDEPEPDAAIVRGSLEKYLDHPPGAADVLSVIEVADSSLSRDLGIKLRLYAAAGIGQYIVVDLVHDQVLVHEQQTSGGFGEPTALKAGQALHIRAAAGKTVTVEVVRLLP